MEGPNVKTIFRDEKRNITYEIWAYRRVKEAEALDAIASLHATLKKKRQTVQPGKTYPIWTIYH